MTFPFFLFSKKILLLLRMFMLESKKRRQGDWMKIRRSILIALATMALFGEPLHLKAAAKGNSRARNEQPVLMKKAKRRRNSKDSIDQFIDEICNEAQEMAAKNDLYASVMLAQAILESGSGTSVLSNPPYYNIFGMKGAYQELSTTLLTQEDDGTGQLYTVSSAFRRYPTYKDALLDYVFLLKNGLDHDPLFYKGAWKSQTNDYREATAYLTGTYATDISYAQKLNELIAEYELTYYDEI
jgi:flagellum-specific peptidoglycan hydrolase FlgJ